MFDSTWIIAAFLKLKSELDADPSKWNFEEPCALFLMAGGSWKNYPY